MTIVARALIAAILLLGTATAAEAQLGALVSPGQLSKAHAKLEGLTNCLQCHTRGQQVDADKCLACHKPIAARIAARTGIHRNVTTDCVTCHVEHAGAEADLRPFDLTTFDHARDVGFTLDGLHAPIAAKCDACHKTRSYLTAQTTCASCHRDPHKGSLGTSCATCHSASVPFAAAVKGFDHDTTAFSLKGAHGTVACESCHKNKQYKGIAFGSCASCHTDPHASRMGSTCASCHTEASWRTTKVDHARTAFPLKAKHAEVACAKCHTKSAATVKVAFGTCAACHSDPHAGVFAPRDCAACHTESGFSAGTFDHTATGFPLADKHAGLTCVACHKTSTPQKNDFRGQSAQCQTCHTDVHRGELGQSCTTCHTASTFAVTSFTHARTRPFFAGQHASLTCAQCHVTTMQPARTAGPVVMRTGFTTTPTACVSCHADVHLGQLGATCENCHDIGTAKFATVGFSHARTTFPLTGKHIQVPCADCHKSQTGMFPSGAGTAVRFKGLGDGCAACHQDPHKDQLGSTCQSCHSTSTFALPDYKHRNAGKLGVFFTGRHLAATCVSCHKPPADAPLAPKALTSFRISATCTACHVDVHRGALGTDCAACHRP